MPYLYYFNIVHDNIDKGLETNSPRWVQKTWDEIEEDLDKIPTIDKMYNDSIIVGCPEFPKPEVFAPDEVAKALDDDEFPDGNNKRILLKLAGKGVSLVPCEDLALYRKHHRISVDFDSGKIHPLCVNLRQKSLNDRDRFIGEVIYKTIQPDDVGVILLGRKHNKHGKMVRFLNEYYELDVKEMNDHVRNRI